MKKSILISCIALATLSLTALGFVNWSSSVKCQEKTGCSKAVVFKNDIVNKVNLNTKPLLYKVESRFMNTVTKENLDNAKSIIDILPKKATNSIESYQGVRVAVLHDDEEISEIGEGHVLNTAQKSLLQSTDYSSNIYIKANYRGKIVDTGKLDYSHLTYYMTVTPKKQAEFINGHDALIDYLKENSKEETSIIQRDHLKPGRVSFTVTKTGGVANVNLSSTSGYASVDPLLVELINNTSGKWNPATNSKGEKVDQELVFFFGLQGC